MNYIVKIVGGKPVVFGTSGKEDNGASVYVFEEEEAFDAALAEGMIPVGSIVIKTYDAVEMAGGPFDAELSDESENAPQNKVVKAAIDEIMQPIEGIAGKVIYDIRESDNSFLGAINNSIGSALDTKLVPLIDGYSNRSYQTAVIDFGAVFLAKTFKINNTIYFGTIQYAGDSLSVMAVRFMRNGARYVVSVPGRVPQKTGG